MASEEGCFTLTWEVASYSFLLSAAKYRELWTPAWKIARAGGSAWGRLSATPNDLFIRFNQKWLEGCFPVDRCEMSLISSCGVVSLKKYPNSCTFDLEKNAVFDENGKSILLNDTLTLLFKMWGKTIRTMEFRVSSVLHYFGYVWNIEKFASSGFHDTYIKRDNFLFHVSLKKENEEGTCTFEVREESWVEGYLNFVYCAISFTGCLGNVFQRTTSPYNNWLCDIDIFPTNTSIGLQLELIAALHKGCQEQLHSPSEIVKHTNVYEAVSGLLGNDLLLLFRESALSDATLNTEGKSFSAHRSILAARSPVFRALFEKDEMSEGRTGVVDIDDVDSETVERMLIFLYGDSLEDLQWKEASALYFAADKYDVLPLKEKCAAILKAGLTADNSCDALVLADKHSDQELIECVVNYIFVHEEVVSSAQWDELEKSNCALAAKTTRRLFLKRGKN